MRTLILAGLVGLVGLSLAAAGCSKSTQEKAGQDLKAVGSDAATAAKDVANAPAAKELGSDLKQGAGEAADKTKEVAAQAGEKLKEGASDAGDKLKAGAKDAGAKTDAALNKAKDKSESK